MAFKAYEEVHEDQSLQLPIGGRTYTVLPPSAAVGMALSMRLAAGIVLNAGVPLTDDAIAEADAEATVGDDEVPDFARQCLGAAYDEMLADKVPQPKVEFAVQTAFLAWTLDKAAAEMFWNSAGKAGAPSQKGPARRRTATPTLAAAVSMTPTPASPTGTRSRKASPKAASRAAASSGS